MKVDLDLSGVSTMSSRVVVPTGNYAVRVTSAEPVEAKKKGNYYIQVAYSIVDGEYEGTVLTDRLNIVNDNDDAQRIGLSQLKTLLTAGNHKNPDYLKDTQEMVGLELSIYVEEVDHSFEAKDGSTVETTQNVFKGYNETSGKSAPAKKSPSAKSRAKKEDVKEEPKEEKSFSPPWARAN